MSSPATIPATLDALLSRLQQGELLLMPNDRAARELRAAYDAAQRSMGSAVWEPASALSWTQWTSGLYSELILDGAETRLLLNPAQEHSLWSAIVAEDPPANSLGPSDSLAELAASAFQVAAAWGTVTGSTVARLRGYASNEDTRTFARWAEEFGRRCAKQRCLPPALLDDALAQHIAAGRLAAPATLRVAGFTRLTPSQQALLDALLASGTQIEHLSLEYADPATDGLASEGLATLRASVVAATPQEELLLAARWMRRTLEAAPTARIGVLVPNLAEDRAALEAVLREVLAPELQAIDADLSSTPWELSGGVPLSSLAMIAAALDLVRWATGALAQPRITSLLLSPYLGSSLGAADERDASARLDALIRRKEKLLRPELTLDAFLRLLDKYASPLAWPRNLATELARSGDLSKPRSFADWMEFVRGLVQATNWPGPRAQNATEFEAARAWESVLDLVSTLDFGGRRVALAEALEALELQAQRTQFSPPSTHAPIQVVGPTESEGSVFDAVLFLRATDESWPAAERPHPLLPWSLQAALHMPGTDPLRTAADARSFTAGLLERCGTVLFTCARENSDGHLRPSPLLAELGLTPLDAAALLPFTDPAADETPQVPCTVVPDDTPLPRLPSAEYHGGSRVLQLQAACGFRAFAELRLNSGEPDSNDIGLDAAESGSLVHSVLHRFWGEMQSSTNLAAKMESGELTEVLVRCIDEAIATENHGSAASWDEAYIQLQRERLLRLLLDWADCEFTRSPFTVIATERDETVPVGPLNLRVRIDRIDQVEGGSVFVDYKTGASASPAQWKGPRPEEPQLPLYTLLAEAPELKALAFAKLRIGEGMKWSGLQAAPYLLGPKAKNSEDFPALMEGWRSVLTQLAYDFAEGRATVNPLKYPTTCEHCGQRLLCRVDPANLPESADADEEFEAGDE